MSIQEGLTLQTSLEELTLLALEHLPQAVLIADHDGQVIFRSAAARSMLSDGLDVTESIRTDRGNLINWPQEISNLDISAGSASYHDVTINTRSGRSALVDIDLTVLCRDIEGDRAMSVLVVVTDKSKWDLLDTQRASADRLSDETGAVARLVHELANPLDGAMRYLHMAEASAGENSRESLLCLRKAITQIAGVISHHKGKVQPKHSISELIGEAINAFTLRAEAQGIEIKYDADAGETYEADFRLFQVFCNVIKNSLDAMPGGGTIEITHFTQGEHLVMDFADSGPGLTEPEPERIFAPFYTTKPADEGTGLGLTVCRELLTPLGGEITATNGPVSGLLVTIKLPIAGGDR